MVLLELDRSYFSSLLVKFQLDGTDTHRERVKRHQRRLVAPV